jgi:hypothetical protein
LLRSCLLLLRPNRGGIRDEPRPGGSEEAIMELGQRDPTEAQAVSGGMNRGLACTREAQDYGFLEGADFVN